MPTTKPKNDSRFQRKLKAYTKQTGRTPSSLQEDIFRFIANPKAGNCIVQACAGSGKTTTIMGGMTFVPLVKDEDEGILRKPNILYLVFNSKLRSEAKSRPDLPDGVHVHTFHSYGYAAVRSHFPRPQEVEDPRSWLSLETYKVSEVFRELVPNMPWADYRRHATIVMSIVSWAKNNAVRHDELPMEAIEDSITESLTKNHASPAQYAEWAQEVMENCIDNLRCIDYDDMIYLPSIIDMDLGQYDMVFVDECQDLNPAQVILLQKITAQHPKTRFIFVGDENQSIYLFRGATADCIQKLNKDFHCTQLPLSITYRCSQAVVQEASKYRPGTECAPNAAPGCVAHIDEEDYRQLIQEGDMTLCRCNAPLVRSCLSFLKQGLPAAVVGADIGRSLFKLYKDHVYKLFKQHGDNYIAVVEARRKALSKLIRPGEEQYAQLVADRFDALMVLIPNAQSTYKEIENTIKELFQDDCKPYSFSTIHKAKGLEADNVFLIRPDLVPHPKAMASGDPEQIDQELNAAYVAVTRAKHNFYYVVPPREQDNAVEIH